MVILSGVVDEPRDELGGRTPLQAAPAKALRELEAIGRVGGAFHHPEDAVPAPEGTLTSLLGYDPALHGPGRAYLEATQLALPEAQARRAFCLSFVPLAGGSVAQAPLSPGEATPDEMTLLSRELLSHWRGRHPWSSGWTLAHADATRSLIVDSSAEGPWTLPDPWTLAGGAWRKSIPKSEANADRLAKLVSDGQEFLARHSVNLARAEAGLRPLSLAWPWGHSRPESHPPFEAKVGVAGVLLSTSHWPATQAAYFGLDAVVCSPEDLAEHGADRLRARDLVIVYLTAGADASSAGDLGAKVDAIDRASELVIAPLRRRLEETVGAPEPSRQSPGWRIAVACDMPYPVGRRAPAPGLAPFLVAGALVRSHIARRLTEPDAEESDIRVDPGHDLLEYILQSGVRQRPGPRVRR